MQETKDLQRDMWRYLEKINTNKRLRCRHILGMKKTHRWEKKGENVKTKDLQSDIWRHLEKKNNRNKGLR